MQRKPAKKVLLKSGWQAVNIGDIGHTPGALELLRRYLPEVEVTLWPNNLDLGAASMLRREFPEVRHVWGGVGPDGRPDSEEVRKAFAEADFFLHGSGPSLVAERQTRSWVETTGKPFGVLGITATGPHESTEISQELKTLLSAAEFVFVRDTTSLGILRSAGVSSHVLDFAPDATYAITLLDDDAALRFMASTGIHTGQFLCVITRLRFTPYHTIHGDGHHWSAEKIREVEDTNAHHAEVDHAKLRKLIIRWVRETGRAVLLCPEMIYQTELLRPLLFDPLPEDVKPYVAVRETYWLPDEAGSVYKRSCAVFSVECHSPIIACALGTPGVYIRQPQDTVKGQMWRDVGLGESIFEIEKSDGDNIAQRALFIAENRSVALDELERSMSFIRHRFENEMNVLRGALGL